MNTLEQKVIDVVKAKLVGQRLGVQLDGWTEAGTHYIAIIAVTAPSVPSEPATIVEKPAFENGLVKLLRGQESALTATEKLQLATFLTAHVESSPAIDESNASFTEQALRNATVVNSDEQIVDLCPQRDVMASVKNIATAEPPPVQYYVCSWVYRVMWWQELLVYAVIASFLLTICGTYFASCISLILHVTRKLFS
ncbi:TPA: hypothetical protein N0F65_004343 [Lagenidium giganteum]|uniref:Uncharacterized protein n=1 Tax=Lagenidium giganteum TaxID=4803 RepID=A0AAV2YMK4_9STRA|nr:TPA: hypothetical protein N0F65_004343 [Lagenidium giganteum]